MNPLILTTFFLLISSFVSAQEINQEIKIDNEQPFLVGQVNLKGLRSNTYQNWYTDNYDAYEVDLEIIAPVKTEMVKQKILVFIGTWCGDSKREVPRFIKILEAMDFPMENLKIVALDRRKGFYKKSPNGEEWGLRIKRVPTFIFYKNGKEINRIIERPIVSLEADIKAIITNADYTPNYPKSLHFD